MKVEQHGPGGPGGPAPSGGPAPIGEAASAARQPGAAPAGDQITLSPEVQVMQTAFERALAQPEIRTDLVARMRELDASGELGRDAGRLADAMIDHWLTTP